MDFDQLHTFLEIVRLKSFSKAAQTCYRTQPAISAQVRQLEQELRADLFERFGSRISLTTAGKIFAEYAEQMLDLRRRAQHIDLNPRVPFDSVRRVAVRQEELACDARFLAGRENMSVGNPECHPEQRA